MQVAFIGHDDFITEPQLNTVRTLLDVLHPTQVFHADQIGCDGNFDWIVWRYFKTLQRVICPTTDTPMVGSPRLRPERLLVTSSLPCRRQRREIVLDADAVLVTTAEFSAPALLHWKAVKPWVRKAFLIDNEGAWRIYARQSD